MIFNVAKFLEYLINIFPSISVTVTYTIFSLIFGYVIGLLVLLCRYSKLKILNLFGRLYLTILRCVPSIILIFLVYYALPALLEGVGIKLPDIGIIYVIITFSLLIGATSSEVLRSAYESVSKGQYEAAVSVGLSNVQAFVRIIVPQALQVAIPNIGNQIAFIIKDGALAYTIGVKDIYGKGINLSTMDYSVYIFEVYAAMTAIYWPIITVVTKLFQYLGKRVSIADKIQKSEKKLAKGAAS